MKTKIFTTTCMAVAIQMTCLSQTNNNTSINTEFLLCNAVPTKTISKAVISSDAEPKKILVTLGASEKSPGGATEELIASKTIQTLNFQLEELNLATNSILLSTKTANPIQTQELLKQAQSYEQKALAIQFQISSLLADNNLRNYNKNKVTIKIMVSTFKGDLSILITTFDLISDSEKEMKLAKELREEAKAQPNLASMVGSMTNAEEKELIALNKQNRAITALSNSSAVVSNHQ